MYKTKTRRHDDKMRKLNMYLVPILCIVFDEVLGTPMGTEASSSILQWRGLWEEAMPWVADNKHGV